MPKFFTTPPTLTVPVASSWQTIDLSSHFGTQDTPVGVLVFMVNVNTATSYSMSARCHGSTDGEIWAGRYRHARYFWVGLSADKKIQLYSGNTTDIQFRLVGFLEQHEAYFPVNKWRSDVAATGVSWVDVNPTAMVQSGDTPIGYLGMAWRANNEPMGAHGVRPNGSTDVFMNLVSEYVRTTIAVPFVVSTTDGLLEVRNTDFQDPSKAGNLGFAIVGYLKQSGKLVSVANAQNVFAVTPVGSVVTVPDTLTLNGQKIEDVLSMCSVTGSSTAGTVLPIFSSSNDYNNDGQLGVAYNLGMYAATGQLPNAFFSMPMLRSRSPNDTVEVFAQIGAISASCTVVEYAYLAYKQSGSARAFMVGDMF